MLESQLTDNYTETGGTKMSNPKERLVMPEYGQVVTIREKYCRKQRNLEEFDSTVESNETFWNVEFDSWKYWKAVPYEAENCIFLGKRILCNGVREYDLEDGYIFHSQERFAVALVSPGPRQNPIYVPLESIET